MTNFVDIFESLGPFAPVLFIVMFLLASALMIWRLAILEGRGFEGTFLGTLVMPYCSGISNLIFAFVLGRSGGKGELIIENCLVNNVTNLTLLLGLPALLWGLNIFPVAAKKGKPVKITKSGRAVYQLNKLSLLLTLVAVLFFTGAVWALAKDGSLDFGDGLVLIGLFIFWQIFQVFDILKKNVREKKSINVMFISDLILIGLGAYGVYLSIEWLVEWINRLGDGFIGAGGLGWLSGWLMVLPNAMLAVYYAYKQRSDIAYSSQVGDGHICIPLCIGLFAIFQNVTLPDSFEVGVMIIAGATVIHFFSVLILGRLPRWLGLIFILSYGYFLYAGLVEA